MKIKEEKSMIKILLATLVLVIFSNCISATLSAPNAKIPVMIGGSNINSKSIDFAAVVNNSMVNSSSSTQSGNVKTTSSSSMNAKINIGPKEISSTINEKVNKGYIGVNRIDIENWIFIMGQYMLIANVKAKGTIETDLKGGK